MAKREEIVLDLDRGLRIHNKRERAEELELDRRLKALEPRKRVKSALGGQHTRPWKGRTKKGPDMKKTIVMKLEPSKETKGCYRYMREAGDEGVDTVYLRKSSVEGKPPVQLTVTYVGT